MLTSSVLKLANLSKNNNYTPVNYLPNDTKYCTLIYKVCTEIIDFYTYLVFPTLLATWSENIMNLYPRINNNLSYLVERYGLTHLDSLV